MNNQKLYALTALFDTPDQIMKAADRVSGEYTNYDVNTPYPVHGMDDVMKLTPSKIGYFTISVGLTCMSLMLYFIYWTNNVDYPQIIGGKPFFAFPTYVPIMFEITILTGAVLSVLMMISILFKFPNNAHPLHDSGYMKNVASDKYGIYVEAKDKNFEYAKVEALFKELGATSISPVYYDEEETDWKPQTWEPKFVIGTIGIAVFTSFSVYMHMNKVLFLPPFNWMMEQPRADYGEVSNFFDDGYSMRVAPAGTIARGYIPYLFESPDSAAKYMSNPTLATKENLELGQKKFLTYCSPCHGNLGEGASRLKGQMPPGPDLRSEMYQDFEDGRFYHTITKGKGIMSGYESQITREERWAIINYIRVLQKAYGVPSTNKEMAENVENNQEASE
jgi:mono/diheme cytochrome c family protein